jgi:dihydroorotate dehydrogenase
MYSRLRPLLFRLDAERAHDLTLTLLRWANYLPLTIHLLRLLFDTNDPRLEVEAFGLRFKNPVGLAAGYDKNGVAVRGLSALGFGHIEVGTVTRLPQAGNPLPRIHRVPEARALINSMGFPNAGVEALPHHLSPSPAYKQLADTTRLPVRVGVNIGKGKDTPLERAAEDYGTLLRQVHTRADYVAVNISSPNTQGLRQLQARAFINDLLKALIAVRDSLTLRVPLLVKIAPDLSEGELDEALLAMKDNGVDGVIATNTTTRRVDVPDYAAGLAGGLSGAPLRARSTEVIRYIARQTAGQLPIIGVGGILSVDDALEKLDAGATLIQIYTGLVYAGPSLVRKINQRLVESLNR